MMKLFFRDWKENDNTISLDDEEVLDVPASLSSVSTYCASLGHKANHFHAAAGLAICTSADFNKCRISLLGFPQNAKYDICEHPRFISSIVLLLPTKFCTDLE
jgi:hypothetical protein